MSAERHAVVFDWNGTLLDDTQVCLQATNETLSLFGKLPITMEVYQDAYIVPIYKMYTRLGCDEAELFARQEESFDSFARHYEQGEGGVNLRIGTRRAIGTLKERGNKVAILSNFTIEHIKAQAARFSILHYLDAIMAHDIGQNVFHKKGKGEKLAAFVEEHEIMRALVVGDTPEEIEIAHAYGFIGVAIKGGMSTAERLHAARPDYTISSIEEIPEIARHVFERSDL